MIKKNSDGDYKFDLVGLIKLVGFVGVLMVFYFTTQSKNDTANAVQDSRLLALEYRATITELGLENINLKLDRLIKTNDSLVIVLGNK